MFSIFVCCLCLCSNRYTVGVALPLENKAVSLMKGKISRSRFKYDMFQWIRDNSDWGMSKTVEREYGFVPNKCDPSFNPCDVQLDKLWKKLMYEELGRTLNDQQLIQQLIKNFKEVQYT